MIYKNEFPFFSIEALDIGDEHIKNALRFASHNLSNLKELVEGDPSFLWILPKLSNDYVQPEWMDKLIVELKATEFQKQTLVTNLKSFAKREGINFGQMMRTLRKLLSSKKDGYQVAEMLEILGREGSIHRLSRISPADKDTQIKNTN